LTLSVLLVGKHAHGTRAIGDLSAEQDISVPPFARIEFAHCETLAEALAVLREQPPQLIFTDLALPDSQGLETFQRLHEEAKETPIVVVSEFEDDETAYQAVRHGAQDCLVEGKLDAAVLSRSMRHALARFAYDDTFRRSHEAYQRALEESDLPSLVADAEGRVLFSNHAALTALGNPPRQVDWSAEDELQPTIGFDSAAPVAVHARTTDTLWNGRLALLVTLEARPTEGSGEQGATLSGSHPASLFEGLVSASPRMRTLFRTCERVAASSATVLIQGETGTGKELVARAIHKRSGRKGRFVALDCGAVQESLIDAELFGHERGAFTGANTRKLGLFRHAHQGTLLLDEINNMPLVSQHSLLRVLQEGVVRPLGGTGEVAVDVRIIAASSVSLFEAVNERRFREDLLYRLDVIRLELLPLRERPEDVLHLLRLFLAQLCARYDLAPLVPGPGFLQAAVDYPWPGNVRQLENFAERLLLTGTPCFSKRDFHDGVRPFLSSQASPSSGAARAQPGIEHTLTEFLTQQEGAYLESLLSETRGSLAATADRAGIDPRTLRRKLKRHGIDRTRFLH
jgi:DNA-binding NtrC family response regulator